MRLRRRRRPVRSLASVFSVNTYRFEALRGDGRTLRGSRAAPDARALRSLLIAEALTPLRISEAVVPRRAGLVLDEETAGRFACELASYRRSGLPLVQALALMADGARKPAARLAEQLRLDVLGGCSLPQALRSVGGHVGALLQALAEAADQTGRQAEVFESGGRGLLATAALRRRLVTLALYPLFVVAIAVGAVALYAYAVLPALEPAFASLGEPPPQTRLVLDLGRTLRLVLPVLGVATAAVAVAIAFSPALRSQAREALGRAATSRALGRVGSDMVFAGFARRMSIALAAGLPLLAAYRVAVAPVSLRSLRTVLSTQEARMRDGALLSEALAAVPQAPSDLVRLARVGESTRRLDRVLAESADALAARAQEKAERVLSVATPIIVVVLGGLVGLVTILVFQGLLAVTDAVGA